MSTQNNNGNIWEGMRDNNSRKNGKYRAKKPKKLNLHDFQNNESRQDNKQNKTKELDVNDVLNEIKALNITDTIYTTNDNKELKISRMCLLINLKSMSSMNGKIVRIIGPLNKNEQRYPVFVYDTKDIVLIKPSNLKIANKENIGNNNNMNKSLKDEINEILEISKNKKHENMAKMFANKLMKSRYNQLNTNLMDDFKKILQGNCIYIPYFLCKPTDFGLLSHLKNDIKWNSNEGMIDWSQHLKHENPSFSLTFNILIEYMSNYFDMEIFASRLNYYRNGQDWKPYHHDSHSYCKNKNDKEDFTIGISFGNERILSFIHVKTGQIFNIPQRNGDCFAFNSIVNTKFKHGVLKGAKSLNERFSIIAWGKRRTLNHRNSGINERNNNNNTFNGRYII